MVKHETYLFVDGNYLEKTLEAHGKNYFNQILVPRYEHIGAESIKNFYYDAYPTKKGLPHQNLWVNSGSGRRPRLW